MTITVTGQNNVPTARNELRRPRTRHFGQHPVFMQTISRPFKFMHHLYLPLNETSGTVATNPAASARQRHLRQQPLAQSAELSIPQTTKLFNSAVQRDYAVTVGAATPSRPRHSAATTIFRRTLVQHHFGPDGTPVAHQFERRARHYSRLQANGTIRYRCENNSTTGGVLFRRSEGDAEQWHHLVATWTALCDTWMGRTPSQPPTTIGHV